MFVGVVMLVGLNPIATGQRVSVSTNVADKATVTDPVVLEIRAAEQARRTGDFLVAPIKSQFDLMQYIQNHPGSSIDMLSPSAKQRFISSVTFNETGLTGFDYSDLRAELTVSQVYQILSLFGAQRVTHMVHGARVATAIDRTLQAPSSLFSGGPIGIGEDHEGYRCEGNHTCSTSPSRICMSGC
jgi:hypothetical protein